MTDLVSHLALARCFASDCCHVASCSIAVDPHIDHFGLADRFGRIDKKGRANCPASIEM